MIGNGAYSIQTDTLWSIKETYMYTLAQKRYIYVYLVYKSTIYGAKVLYLAQLWRSKVRLIETTISKTADFSNYSTSDWY